MICGYPADCMDFSTNGNGTPAPLSAEVTEPLNGAYELTLVHPIDDAGKWQRLVEGCILRAPVPAAMTPRVNFSVPGDDTRREIWRVETDFAGAETRNTGCECVFSGVIFIWKPSMRHGIINCLID